MVNGDDADARDVTASPVKKKSRTEKRAEKKKKKKDKKKEEQKKKRGRNDQAKSKAPDTPAVTPPSILKSKGSSKGQKTKVATKQKPSDHKFARKTIEGAVVCSHDDKHTEFTMALCTLYKKMEVIDSSVVWCPRHMGKHPDWVDADQIPLCHASMSSHDVTFGGMRTFVMKKPWKPDRKWDGKDDDASLQDPEVKFVFCICAMRTLKNSSTG